ncbi:hypothetical protein BKA70DRAFT_1430467 [Coprinopsis sp. MPI-PUGE-AT-0042]|nr:hypothetical protein BKA70DRAFT_1430467 [Coprinopsis sp. MPI-PUGE-AT-0042]
MKLGQGDQVSKLHAGLSEAGGGIIQLLKVYLNMVGDIQYSHLLHTVDQLLLLGGLQAWEKLSSSGHASDEDEEGQELDVSDTAILPATPISNAPPLPPALSSNPTLIPPLSPAGVAPPPSPSQPSHLCHDLRKGGTVHDPRMMEQQSLFLPNPNAPKTPKDLGGEGNPGPIPPDASSHGAPPPISMNQHVQHPQVSPPQPGRYPYHHQPPPPHVIMPPCPTARQITT